MRSKSWILLLIIFCNVFITSGCWNYEEIGDKAIVTGFALDYDKENDQMILLAEIASPKNAGDNTIIESQVFEGTGVNLFDASRDLNTIIGKTILWSHAKVVIFSEDLIKQKDKFISAVDAMRRDNEIRENIFAVVSKEATAGEILIKSDISEPIKAYYIEEILKNEKSVSRYLPIPLFDLIDDLANEGKSPTLPTIHLKDDNGKKIVELEGTEVFKGVKPVGWLKDEETQAFLIAIDEFKGGIIVIEEEIQGEPVKVSLEVYKSKTKITPTYNDELTMTIDVKTTVAIGEIGGSQDVIQEKNRLLLEKDAEELIKRNIEDLIKKCQKEYNSDIFGFGSKVKRELPKVWKEIGMDWDEEFKNLKTQVNVDFNIQGSSLKSEPIKVGEK